MYCYDDVSPYLVRMNLEFLKTIDSYYISDYKKSYILARDLPPLIRDSILKFLDYNERNDPSIDYSNYKVLIRKSQNINNIPNYPNRGLIFIDPSIFNIYNKKKNIYDKNKNKNKNKNKKKVSVYSDEDPFIEKLREDTKQIFDINILKKSIDIQKERIEELKMLTDNDNDFESNYVKATNQINSRKRKATNQINSRKRKTTEENIGGRKEKKRIIPIHLGNSVYSIIDNKKSDSK
jgi:hypothetical protein